MTGNVTGQAGSELVAVYGDDYEMSETLQLSFVRAGDRLVGFLSGGCLIGAAWLVWLLT